MSDVFAFRNSTSVTAEGNITSVMNSLKDTLLAMRGDIAALEPHWKAVEADGYYEAARKLNDNATSAAGILAEVEKALDGVRVGTGKVREEIWRILSESQ